MSVILEFTIGSEDFQLGEVLSGTPNMHLELERIVPTGPMIMPFIWATGDSHDAFEAQVQAHPAVKEFLALDTVEESALYRIVWTDDPTDLIEGIAEADAVVLDARGNEQWTFRLRLPDHDKLSLFHNFILEHDLPIHIDRTYTLTETTERGHRFNLSQEQREALVLAARRGYFATPRETGLDALAEELDISEQAVSNRIRRGNEKILQQVLLTSASDLR
ncbi:helix-turn-helix domain-containing protein [Natronosalvus rutilus]|uniref:Helix-turn-helix domain-containing protein n=1 Tax=Natronosalvus rutilus TaxID=2953753 RepID=A0A9E7N7L3_9EURY|nr:helix-turn-helix domain-containing protein [Natronosalvus rutilus]UTF52965.1 helix-turn-helix domain-containing protein [Natronosalvus rutilus]